MNVNFEEEYVSIILDSGIVLEIDSEVALKLAEKIQDFYKDGFCEDEEEDEEQY